jgi:6-phosphogluconolactonase
MVALLAALLPLAPITAGAETLAYIGTETSGTSQGIYVASVDEATGALSPPRLAAAIGNPNFLALHPKQRWLYAVTSRQLPGGSWKEEVAAFAVQPDGGLALLNTQPSGGSGPCHISVDASGRVLLLANYNGGNVVAYPLGPDGRIGPASAAVQHQGASVHPQRQAAPHPHGIYPDPSQTRAYVPDLGLDKVLIYQLDPATGRLTPNEPPYATTEPGGGPRHMAFHPSARYAYVNLELSSRVAAYRLDAATGALEAIQVLSTLPPGGTAPGNSTAETLVHPSGRFLYVSNRGHDSIAVFAINPLDGGLRFIEATPTGGRTPRSMGFVPGGRFLVAANQNGGTVTVFSVDPEHGTLTPTGSTLPIDRPNHIRFLQR